MYTPLHTDVTEDIFTLTGNSFICLPFGTHTRVEFPLNTLFDFEGFALAFDSRRYTLRRKAG